MIMSLAMAFAGYVIELPVEKNRLVVGAEYTVIELLDEHTELWVLAESTEL